jgi:sulfur dioxygenase
MIFRQLFDSVSSTYSYILASRKGGEALIIDPVLDKVDRYIQLFNELDVKLVKAIDTHLHADHISGMICGWNCGLRKKFFYPRWGLLLARSGHAG